MGCCQWEGRTFITKQEFLDGANKRKFCFLQTDYSLVIYIIENLG
jgi:hypothetical protein